MKNFRKYILMIVCLLFFSVLTIPKMLNHFPYFDEAHAYMLAKFMNFSNFIDIIKAEGHPLGWFLLLIPFAKTNFYYPYPMLIINWICWFSALIVMWTKASFSNWLKIIVTFSSVSVIYLSVAARGYALGFLIIFIIASIYKNQLKHPLIYSVLIGLSFHINLFMGIIGSAFCLIFLFKLYKNKQNWIKYFGIISVFCILFVLPFLTGYGDGAYEHFGSRSLSNFIKFYVTRYHGFFGIAYVGILIYLFKKLDNTAKFFLSYILILNVILFACFYRGFAHHFILMLLYPILAIWIAENQETWAKFNYIYILVALMLLFPLNKSIKYYFFGDKIKAKELVSDINALPELQNNKLYFQETLYPFIPFLNKNIEPYEFCHVRKVDYRTNLYCNVTNWSYEQLFKEEPKLYWFTTFDIPDAPKIYSKKNVHIYILEDIKK